jgi:hypothetical protein
VLGRLGVLDSLGVQASIATWLARIEVLGARACGATIASRDPGVYKGTHGASCEDLHGQLKSIDLIDCYTLSIVTLAIQYRVPPTPSTQE